MGDAFDVVVVGGGIAGSALATRLAGAGIGVLVLERVERFRDRVRGECMMPWGVVEARRLGIEQALLDAGGGFAGRSVGYDETVAPAEAEARAVPLSIFAAGVPGFLDVGHPEASEALAACAAQAGATYLRGVTEVGVIPGPAPSVTFQHEGVGHEVRCRLVVGADGRESVVRKQLGIELQHSMARTMLSGLLVSDLDAWPADQATLGSCGDVHYLVFPRPGGIARLYLGHAMSEKDRFTGPDRAQRFLQAFRVDALPLGDAITSATPAGPCAGHPGTDAWTVGPPVVDGVVLVGDAAGWSNQLIGQGLSIALRDARTVADVVLESDDWSPERFADYVSERSERMHRIHVTGEAMTDVRCDFTPAGRARRREFFAGMLNDPLSLGLVGSMLSGPETAPPEAFGEENRARVVAMG